VPIPTAPGNEGRGQWE